MRRRRLALGAVAGIAVLVAANTIAYAHNSQVDLSASRRFTLARETRALVRAVRSPMRVTAFLNPSGPAGRDARFLLSRFHELNRRIIGRVVDPDENPGAARRFGIGRYSTVVVEYRGRRVEAGSAEELELSTAVLRLLRGRTHLLCPLAGHGEPSLDDDTPDGLSAVRTLLDQNAYETRVLDLTVGDAGVPRDCDAVLLLGPRQPLLAREVEALVAYARNAGKLAVLASPLSGSDPNPLLVPWRVRFTGGLVLDPARSQGLDLSNVIVQDLPSANPVVDGVTSLQFPAGGGLAIEPPDRDGLTVSRLAVTSGRSWVESNPDRELSFDEGDLPGPIVVAAAVDESRVEPGSKIERTRLFVTGCDTWITNRFLDNLGNRRLLVNALAWLTQEAQLVTAVSRPNAPRPLPLTAERQARILVTTVGVVPGLVILAGLVPWWLGRRRRA